MMQTEIDKFQNVFESDTVSGSALISLEGAALASLAISMKRIADLLDGTTLGVSVSDTTLFNTKR